MGYRGDSEISDSEDERSPQGEQPPGVGKRMSFLPIYATLLLSLQFGFRMKWVDAYSRCL